MKGYSVKYYFLYLLLWISYPLAAFSQQNTVKQQYTYKNYTLHDGLPQLQVTHLMQDHKGYIWVSHWNGISRFDGYSFKTFSKDEGLMNHAAFHALEYQPDTLAILSPWGIAIGNEKGFNPYEFPPACISDRNSYILPLDDKLFLSNLNTPGILERKHLIFDIKTHQMDSLPTLQEIFVHGLIAGRNSENYALLTDSCIIFMQQLSIKEKKYWKRVYNDFSLSPMGEWWGYCRKENTFYRIIKKNNEYQEIPTHIYIPQTSTRIFANTFTVTWENKIIFYDEKNELFRADTKEIESLGRKFSLIRNFMTDREGNLWLATEEGLFNYFKCRFRTTKIFPDESSDMTWSIAQSPNGNMLFGTSGKGLFQLDDLQLKAVNVMRMADKDYDGNIMRVYMGAAKNKQGDVYVPYNRGLLQWSKDNKLHFTSLFGNPQMIIPNNNQGDTLYAATWGGMLSIYPNGKIREYKESAGFSPHQNESIARDKYGRFWLGASQKEYLQIFDGDTVTQWKGSMANNIISLASDYKGNIWMGNHKGLFMYEHEKEYHIFKEKIQTPVYLIAPYGDSLMVVATPVKLFIIHLKKYYETGIENIVCFDENSGYTAEGCIQNSFCIDNEGYMWIPTIKCAYRFHPGKSDISAIYDKPLIVNMQYSSDRETWHDMNLLSKDIPLQHHYNSLRFDYLSLSFNAQLNVKYRYRLIGYDKTWSEPTDLRTANYTNLPPGKYQLEVQTSINSEQWSESELSTSIRIKAAFWQTGWFTLLVCLLLISTGYILFRWKNKKKMAQLEHAKQVNELKLKAVRLKSIPHFSANALTNIEYFALENNKEELSKYMSLFSQYTNQTLMDADKNSHSLYDELEYVKLYLQLEKLRYGDLLEYSIDIDPSMDLSVEVPVMFLHTYCENAVKHGLSRKKSTGHLEIVIRDMKEYFMIEVKDDGIGRVAAESSGSFSTKQGLKILEEQIQLYNRNNKHLISQEVIDLKDLHNNPTGTIFKITIPYKFQYN